MRTRISRNGKWASHDTPYLLEYLPSGTFYVRKRIGHRTFTVCLDTKSISAARARVPDALIHLRKKGEALGEVPKPPPKAPRPLGELMHESVGAQPVLKHLRPEFRSSSGRATFGGAAASLVDHTSAAPHLADRTKKLTAIVVRRLLSAWDGVADKTLPTLSEASCIEFFSQLAKRFSASHYNHWLTTFKRVVATMAEHDAGHGYKEVPDPTRRLVSLSQRMRHREMPTMDQFRAILGWLDDHYPRTGAGIRLLAYTGARIGEGRLLRWGDVDMTKRVIKLACLKRRKTSGSAVVRWIPMIPDAIQFFDHWYAQLRPHPQDPVLPKSDFRRHVLQACSVVGAPPLRVHDFRHFFATRCIEAGIDIPTVSKWLGHLDGGALALRVYGHLRNEHSLLQAAKLQPAESHDYANHHHHTTRLPHRPGTEVLTDGGGAPDAQGTDGAGAPGGDN